jgi:hypothetical protein
MAIKLGGDAVLSFDEDFPRTVAGSGNRVLR